MDKDNKNKGWRFYHIIHQGVHKHPFITVTKNISQASIIFWLPTSTALPPSLRTLTHTHTFTPDGRQALIVLDEGDGNGVYPRASKAQYGAYFKRSWITKRSGEYKGPAKRLSKSYFPMVYASSDDYHQGVIESVASRWRDIVCSLRCYKDRQPTRCKILDWTHRFVNDHKLHDKSIVGEVNHGGRREINQGYFGALRSTKIVVTCNPSHWEGDFRLWEAMLSGALVFVDEMWVPQPYKLENNVHVVVYDTRDESAFRKKLQYFLAHPQEARTIAMNGYRHALRYHRSVSRVDFFLRSLDEEYLLDTKQINSTKDSPYTETALQIKSLPDHAVMVNPKPQNWARR